MNLNLFVIILFRLQEVILDHSDKDSENGRIPRTIECELTEDLTGICSPGKFASNLLSLKEF